MGKERQVSSELPVGCKLKIDGRIQSREYEKQTPMGTEKRTAYEVSASHIELIANGLKQNT